MIVHTPHIDQIMAVMYAAFDPAFGEAWTRRQLTDSLAVGRCHYQLVGADGAPPATGSCAAGFALSRHGVEEEELLLLAVRPEFRRRGLGRAMLASLAHAAKSRGAQRLLLEMRSSNPAERLYRSFGFEPVGKRQNYYRAFDGARIDAITFAFRLE